MLRLTSTTVGDLYSSVEVKHDPERLAGWANTRRPETVGELLQFVQAANCKLDAHIIAIDDGGCLTASGVSEGAHGGSGKPH